MMSIRILLVEDHAMVREGLKAVLEKEHDLMVVGQAATGYQAVEAVAQTAPHVVVMDVALPDLNGIEATCQILKTHPQTKIVGISASASQDYLNGMLQAGASAYLLKRSAAEELVQAVRLAVQGKTFLSPEIAGTVVDEHVRSHVPARSNGARSASLTSRERELLQLLAEGNTAKEMANTLHVSVKTIETHRRNVMQKLRLHSVAKLTKYAVREGVTSVDF